MMYSISLLVLVTVVFDKFSRGEEASILTGATMDSYDILTGFTWNSNALVDGNF